MHIIRRTLAILAAALLVVGITFGFAQSSSAQAFAPARPGRHAPAPSQPDGGTINAGTAQSSSAPAGGFEQRDSRSPSLFGAVEIVKNLAIISIIVALVALATRATRGLRPKGRADLREKEPS